MNGRYMKGPMGSCPLTGISWCGGISGDIFVYFKTILIKQQKQGRMKNMWSPGSDTQVRYLHSGAYINWP